MCSDGIKAAYICPSGNRVTVSVRQERVVFVWDEPPPLSPDDQCYYTDVIAPGVLEVVSDHYIRGGEHCGEA